MIRSTLSFCALFVSLILASKWVQESSRPQPAATPLPSVQTIDDELPTQAAPPLLRSGDVERDSRTSCDKRETLGKAHGSTSLASICLVSFDEDLTEKVGDAIGAPASAKVTDEAAEDSSPGEPLASAPHDKPAPAANKNSEAEPTAEKSEPTEPALTPELLELRNRLRQCLAYYYFRPENVATRSPWGSMHWMIAYGVDSQLIVGTRKLNAIGYLNYNGVCNGQRLFYLSNGKVQAQVGVGVQGHAGQYLAMLAQSRVKSDYPLVVDGQSFTVADLIEHEKETCRPASELTFKLIALSHYLKSDEKWVANDGQKWDIPRLIKEELAQPINGAACGGTHRMTGFSYAVRKREQREEPIDGQWKRAKKYVEDFHEYTFKLQNPDASFSTEWFVMRADSGDIGRRLQTTGHITEWLAFSLSKEQLIEPRMVKSVNYLTNLLLENRNEKWSIGPLGHGLHALAIYDERVFGGKPGTRQEQLAEIRKTQHQR
jgi:hypothetical protein